MLHAFIDSKEFKINLIFITFCCQSSYAVFHLLFGISGKMSIVQRLNFFTQIAFVLCNLINSFLSFFMRGNGLNRWRFVKGSGNILGRQTQCEKCGYATHAGLTMKRKL